LHVLRRAWLSSTKGNIIDFGLRRASASNTSSSASSQKPAFFGFRPYFVFGHAAVEKFGGEIHACLQRASSKKK